MKVTNGNKKSSIMTTSSDTGSKLNQLGIYRTIDFKTDEFLRMSRKRQMRRGCACASLSTAITVVIVVVILLVYEYTIAVESDLLQKTKWMNYKNDTNKTFDKPFAERLDRSYFGFDQDYFERMPLLVNAMQENSYIDPSIEGTTRPKARFIITNFSNFKPSASAKSDSYGRYSIRKTSPRPFIFEYKHQTPEPFTKTYGSRSWVESYRNAQRLKNLQQVIKYLERTINAKTSDLYTLPTSTIAFSGIYLEPKDVTLTPNPTTISDQELSQSTKVEAVKSIRVDPLLNFKPKSPGEVNLLADGSFRFAPIPTVPYIKEKYPMFRPIKPKKKNCDDINCKNHKLSLSDDSSSEFSSSEIPKAFSVLVNLFPLKNSDTDSKSKDSSEYLSKPSSTTNVKNIYITTTPPIIQFRRKSTTPVRRVSLRPRKPAIYMPRIKGKTKNDYFNSKSKNEEPKMVVHVNVYDPVDVTKYDKISTSTAPSTTRSTQPVRVTEFPILASTQVEDYHVGSSGIIPIQSLLTPPPPPPISTHPSLPTVTTTNYFDHGITSTTQATSKITPPNDIIKFSQEDAKIPEEYKNIFKLGEPDKDNTNYNNDANVNKTSQTIISRRTEYADRDIDYIDVEPKTLIIKLQNEFETTTESSTTKKDAYDYDDSDNEEETTSVKTYVPQINGHYRSINQNSRNINNWLNVVGDRKRRLAKAVSSYQQPTNAPQYVEIKRNRTATVNGVDSEDDSNS